MILSNLAVQKIAAGFWRATSTDGYYSNLHKEADGWHADIRNARGELVRFAGIWPTRRDAVEEVAWIFGRIS